MVQPVRSIRSTISRSPGRPVSSLFLAKVLLACPFPLVAPRKSNSLASPPPDHESALRRRRRPMDEVGQWSPLHGNLIATVGVLQHGNAKSAPMSLPRAHDWLCCVASFSRISASGSESWHSVHKGC